MEKPEHKHIEQYVTNPEELTQKERARLEYWIENDPEVNQVYRWLREFYSEYRYVQKSKQISHDRPAVITLKSNGDSLKRSKTLILAAQTPLTKKNRSKLRSIQTLLSEKDKTLIRVLDDQYSNQIDIHVLSEHLSPDEIVLLELPDMDSYLISDSHGRFRIDKQKFDGQKIKEWDRCRLFLPLARADLFYDRSTGEINMDSHTLDKINQQVEISSDGDYYKFKVKFEKAKNVYKAVIKDESNTHFFLVESGQFLFQKSLLHKSDLSVFLYN